MTKEQQLIELYRLSLEEHGTEIANSYANLELISNKLDLKGSTSVRGKLSRLGIYKREELIPEPRVPIITKKDYVSSLRSFAKLKGKAIDSRSFNSLAQAKTSDIELLFELIATANQQSITVKADAHVASSEITISPRKEFGKEEGSCDNYIQLARRVATNLNFHLTERSLESLVYSDVRDLKLVANLLGEQLCSEDLSADYEVNECIGSVGDTDDEDIPSQHDVEPNTSWGPKLGILGCVLLVFLGFLIGYEIK